MSLISKIKVEKFTKIFSISAVFFLALFFLADGLTNSNRFDSTASVISGSLKEKKLATDLTIEVLHLLEKPDLPAGKLEEALAARKKAMLVLMKNDTTSAMRISFDDQVRMLIPQELRPDVEENPVTLEGTYEMEIGENFVDEEQYFHYLVINPSTRVQLHLTNTRTDIKSGMKLRVSGVRIDDHVAVNTLEKNKISILDSHSYGATGSGNSFVPRGPGGVTTKKLAVILYNFTDNTFQPVTRQWVLDTVWGSTNSVKAYYNEATNGKIAISSHTNPNTGDVFGWYTIPSTTNPCDLFGWAALARAAAAANGFVASNYDNVMYVLAPNPCLLAGSSATPGSYVYLNGGQPLTVIVHELGHNFGLGHAGVHNCYNSSGQRVAISESCTILGFNDPFDGMGNSASPLRLFNNFHKGQITGNLLTAQNTLDVTADGVYNIVPIGTVSTGVQSLRIPRDIVNGTPTSYYYLEARQPSGVFDNFLSTDPVVNGVSIRIAPPYSSTNQSGLIDTTPISASFLDSSLTVGRNFEDTTRGIRVTTQSVSSNGATVAIDFGTPACTQGNPMVSIFPLNQWGHAGETKSYTLTLDNNNTSTCSSSTFHVTPTLPVGWTQTPSTINLTVPSGGVGTQIFAVTSASNATSSLYPVTQTATNSLFPQFSGSAVANYNVTPGSAFVDFITPTNGATVSGTFAIQATTNITNGTLDFYFDTRRLTNAIRPPGPYIVSLNTTATDIIGAAVQNGVHTIQVVVLDGNVPGGSSTSKTINVTVNNPLPVVSVTSPSGGATLSGAAVTISANATSNAFFIQRVDFLRGNTLIGSDISAPYAATWNTTSVADGTYSLSARAFDPAGNITTSSPINVVVDNVVCLADYDHNGQVAMDDIFAFINNWFAGNINTDLDHSGALEPGDILEFISVWFVGC